MSLLYNTLRGLGSDLGSALTNYQGTIDSLEQRKRKQAIEDQDRQRQTADEDWKRTRELVAGLLDEHPEVAARLYNRGAQGLKDAGMPSPPQVVGGLSRVDLPQDYSPGINPFTPPKAGPLDNAAAPGGLEAALALTLGAPGSGPVNTAAGINRAKSLTLSSPAAPGGPGQPSLPPDYKAMMTQGLDPSGGGLAAVLAPNAPTSYTVPNFDNPQTKGLMAAGIGLKPAGPTLERVGNHLVKVNPDGTVTPVFDGNKQEDPNNPMSALEMQLKLAELAKIKAQTQNIANGKGDAGSVPTVPQLLSMAGTLYGVPMPVDKKGGGDFGDLPDGIADGTSTPFDQAVQDWITQRNAVFSDLMQQYGHTMPSGGASATGQPQPAPAPATNEPKPAGGTARWAPVVRNAAKRFNVPADLITAVMAAESGGRADAVSPVGAIGLMQLMPGTAKDLGVDPNDPRQNVEGGAKYLGQLLQRYKGDTVKAVAAYNAGPGAVDMYGGVPPFPETQAYVRRVMARLGQPLPGTRLEKPKPTKGRQLSSNGQEAAALLNLK